VGSGAGLPGIILAIARPDLRVTLLEPLLRRTTFLSEVVGELGLEAQIAVDRGRAEERHGSATFGVVTSRAVAPLERLLRWSLPLVAPQGALVAMKGASVADEVVDARTVLRQLGCGEAEILRLEEPWLVEPTCAVRVAWATPGRVGLAATSPGRRRPRPRGGAR
jgi:16S rRNA (guanine527-N7)-methyltransferase